MEQTVNQIAALFQETQHAHHQAFIDVDGLDPEWPLWYAEYLCDKLPPLLQTGLTKSELTYWVVHLDKRQQLEAPEGSWAHFYAKVLVDEYL